MPKIKLKVMEPKGNDPWLNLATEEYLLNSKTSEEIILLLWQNDKTIVIGANQNPWKECNIRLFEEDGGRLARRISGGGAVYHDLGNLNFSLLIDQANYDFDKQVKIITDAIADHQIIAEFKGRNDILANGKKFSGNAFYHNANKVLHHGTLLVDCDFTEMTKYLQVSEKKIQSKGIESIRARVINLKDLNSSITINALKESIKKQFALNYGVDYVQITDAELDMHKLDSIYRKHCSWDWRFGDTPECQISFANRFHWGELSINLNVEKGLIKNIQIYSDAMDVRLVENIKSLFTGLPFDADAIQKKYNDYEEKQEYKDVINWFVEEVHHY
ncbi:MULTISPECIES: lipoate--protein ligase [unclassified Dehalobacter]|uniref:lipoate--protein ligase n=1 Tax=unclassified Dehalobacter TaxID=2635733 RepID=UPI00028A4BB3|nr:MULTISPECIES: lipoate--protein ligase [unclassified Dehalobacter]AFV01197.1 Lipoate-protein ligase A [Dehalobacter sp. DCA]AFV04239.1 Lipoate-protein ligase A [Dehalobacter sp. CF]